MISRTARHLRVAALARTHSVRSSTTKPKQNTTSSLNEAIVARISTASDLSTSISAFRSASRFLWAATTFLWLRMTAFLLARSASITLITFFWSFSNW